MTIETTKAIKKVYSNIFGRRIVELQAIVNKLAPTEELQTEQITK